MATWPSSCLSQQGSSETFLSLFSTCHSAIKIPLEITHVPVLKAPSSLLASCFRTTAKRKAWASSCGFYSMMWQWKVSVSIALLAWIHYTDVPYSLWWLATFPDCTLSILLWNQGTGPLCQPSQFLFLLTSYHLFSFPPTQGITSLVCVGVGMKHRFFLLLFLHILF